MTERQITRKLEKAGISLQGLEIKREEIEISIGYQETTTPGGRTYGECDADAIEQRHKEIAQAIPELSAGYYTGYGSLVLQEGYQPRDEWSMWTD